MIQVAFGITAIDLKTNSCWNTVIDFLAWNLIPHFVSDLLFFTRVKRYLRCTNFFDVLLMCWMYKTVDLFFKNHLFNRVLSIVSVSVFWEFSIILRHRSFDWTSGMPEKLAYFGWMKDCIWRVFRGCSLSIYGNCCIKLILHLLQYLLSRLLVFKRLRRDNFQRWIHNRFTLGLLVLDIVAYFDCFLEPF